MEADQIGRLRDILEEDRLVAAYVKDISETDFGALRFVGGHDAGQFAEGQPRDRVGAREWSRGVLAVRPVERYGWCGVE